MMHTAFRKLKQHEKELRRTRGLNTYKVIRRSGNSREEQVKQNCTQNKRRAKHDTNTDLTQYSKV